MTDTLPAETKESLWGKEMEDRLVALPLLFRENKRGFMIIIYEPQDGHVKSHEPLMDNGIAIMDMDNSSIICSGIMAQIAPSQKITPGQRMIADQIRRLPWGAFKDYVNRQPSCKVPIE
jgi:hypothetical protein